MKVTQYLIIIILSCVLSSCTLMCRNDCHRVRSYKCTNICDKKTTASFPNCPCVVAPGFYKTDLNCIENLQRFSALRARGIGVIILGDRLRFIIPTDTVFTTDDLDINACHMATIADIAEILKGIPCSPIIITGHTDNVGPRRKRFLRSRALAQTIAAHLWAQGVTWNRMYVCGKADCDQIASDMSVFGSTDNRRVEIRVDFSGNEFCNNSYCPDCMGPRPQ